MCELPLHSNLPVDCACSLTSCLACLPAAEPYLPDQIAYLDTLVALNISGADWLDDALPDSWQRAGVFPSLVTLDARYNYQLSGEARGGVSDGMRMGGGSCRADP